MLIACFIEECIKKYKNVTVNIEPNSYLHQSLRFGDYWKPGFDRSKPTRISEDNEGGNGSGSGSDDDNPQGGALPLQVRPN